MRSGPLVVHRPGSSLVVGVALVETAVLALGRSEWMVWMVSQMSRVARRKAKNGRAAVI